MADLTLNDVLRLSGSAGAAFNGGLLLSSERTNNTGSATATSVPVPSNVKRITLSQEEPAGVGSGFQDFVVWILPSGSSAPTKATPTIGGMIIDVSVVGPTVSYDIDPTFPLPTMWVGEDGANNQTFHVTYQDQSGPTHSTTSCTPSAGQAALRAA